MIKNIAFFILIFVCVDLRAQELAISSNLADYADFGTLNLGAEYGIARHWSLNATVKYNPFSYQKAGDYLHRKQRSFALGTKYWPWNIFSGWWLAASCRYQEYNVGGVRSQETSEGDRVGAGASLGYTYMLSPHFNIDIGAGFWTGYGSNTTYSCPRCGRVLSREASFFFLPSDIILAVIYVF